MFYYIGGSIMAMILHGRVDTHYTLLQGHTIYWKIDPFVFSLLMITVVFLRLPSSLGVVLRPPFVSSTCYDNNDMLLVTSPKAS